MGVTVSKKQMPLAVQRNRVKRQLRACVKDYCPWKTSPDKKGVAMFFFHAKEEVATKVIEKAVRSILTRYFEKAV